MSNINYAHPLLRLVAYLVDKFIAITIFILILMPAFSIPDLFNILNSLLAGAVFLIYLGIFMPIFYSFLISKFGGTPGMFLTGIKVIKEDGNNISFKRALFRTYVGSMTAALFMGLGYIWMFFDNKKQGWNDLVSGNVVVKVNSFGVFLSIALTIILLLVNLSLLGTTLVKITDEKGQFVPVINNLFEEVNTTLKENDSKTAPSPTPTYIYPTSKSPIYEIRPNTY